MQSVTLSVRLIECPIDHASILFYKSNILVYNLYVREAIGYGGKLISRLCTFYGNTLFYAGARHIGLYCLDAFCKTLVKAVSVFLERGISHASNYMATLVRANIYLTAPLYVEDRILINQID